MNRITVSGIVNEEPHFSHLVYGEEFYEVKLTVTRKSEAKDTLKCVVSEVLLSACVLGCEIILTGEVRTWNYDGEDGKRHTDVFVFAKSISPYGGNTDENTVELIGYVCKEVSYRITPLGREVADLLIACNRPYRKSDCIPCISWGRNARRSRNMEVGTIVKINGRLQSREYRKRISDMEFETRTAYEVSVSSLEVVED